jgi:hypothetical protein
LRTRVSLFVWLLYLDLFGLGGPTSSYATAGIAFRVSGALKPTTTIRWGYHRWGLVKIINHENHDISYSF